MRLHDDAQRHARKLLPKGPAKGGHAGYRADRGGTFLAGFVRAGDYWRAWPLVSYLAVYASLLAAMLAATPTDRCVRVCKEIRELTVPLTVTAVYTAAGLKDEGVSIDVEQIVEIRR